MVLNKKISDMPELLLPAATDILTLLDITAPPASRNKRITVANFVAGGIVAPADPLYVTLAVHAGLPNERVLIGTVNQVILVDGGAGGNIILSTPQDIAVGSSPTFAGLTIIGNILVGGTVDGVDLATLATVVGLIQAAQFVTIAADPTLTNERILTGTVNQVIIADGGAGNPVVLSTPQDIHAGASPTFANLTVTNDVVANNYTGADRYAFMLC